jgi:glucan-binding YG repeat protein
MKFKKLIPLCFLAIGLTLAVPAAVSAAGTSGPEQTETEVQTNGWTTDHTSYLQNGKKITGVRQLQDGYYYYFNADGILVTGKQGVIVTDQSRYFIKTDGTLLRNAWGVANENTYYAGDDARLYTNTSAFIGGKIYCFNAKGCRLSGGLVKLNGDTYLLGAKGIAKTGLRRYNGQRYFFNTSDGKMLRNCTVKYNGKLYYAKSDGTFATGWFRVGKKRYYANSAGRLKTGWQTYNGQKYYFNSKTGAMRTGITKVGDYYYYYASNGKLRTGWFKANGKKYYGTPSGSLKGALMTGFQRIGTKRYLFGTKGALRTGWKRVDGYKYYLGTDGVVTTGWRKIKNKWYFFESSGAMKTGWLVHNGNFYYMNPSTGAMVTGNQTINGKTYNFSSSGIYSQKALSGSWVVKVNRALNVVTVYKGDTPVRAFLCSTGLNNATPLGTFRIIDKLQRHELNGPTWGYYCSHITSDILFHSIPAPTTDRTQVPSYKFNVLGQQASQGCIRLAMGDAKWLYDTVPIGTTVVIYDDPTYPGPLGKPSNIKMNESPTYYYDPTDPIEYPSYSTSK